MTGSQARYGFRERDHLAHNGDPYSQLGDLSGERGIGGVGLAEEVVCLGERSGGQSEVAIEVVGLMRHVNDTGL